MHNNKYILITRGKTAECNPEICFGLAAAETVMKVLRTLYYTPRGEPVSRRSR